MGVRRVGAVGVVCLLVACTSGAPSGAAWEAGSQALSGGPSARLTANPTSGGAPLTVFLDGSGSQPAPDGTWIASCSFDFGDGQSLPKCFANHSYAQGAYTARFTATDNLGRAATATVAIYAGVAPPPPDAGPGVPDAGTGLGDGGLAGGDAGWQLLGAAQGLPPEVRGVSADEGGNLWVAGGASGLFVLTPGATQLRRFTVADGLTGYDDGTGLHGQAVISVAGGPPGTVFVGYQGLPGCSDAFERYNFQPDGGFTLDAAHRYIWKSGDADRVSLAGAGISVVHYDISSGPGIVKPEPQGREKICSVLRIAYHAPTSSVWFGGNHGVAWGDARSAAVTEHTHPAINGYKAVSLPDGGSGYHYVLLTDNYYGLSVQRSGDVWIGGANRSANFRAVTLNDFWQGDYEIQKTKIDVWPDAQPFDAYPWQRDDDNVSDMAAMSDGTVWVSSVSHGLAHWTPSGISYLRDTTIQSSGKATALEADPQDGSLWIGYIWGGVSRLKDGKIWSDAELPRPLRGGIWNASEVVWKDARSFALERSKRAEPLVVVCESAGCSASGVLADAGDDDE